MPEHDPRALFEKLILDGFQAGLSWWSILSRREGFRAAFEGFHPEAIAAWDDARLEALLQDPRIIRNRAKVYAARGNARAFLEIPDFSVWLWRWVDGRPIHNHWETLAEVPVRTDLSRALAKELKARGFSFCGPTIVYAFLQAVGVVNDHLVGCFRHGELEGMITS